VLQTPTPGFYAKDEPMATNTTNAKEGIDAEPPITGPHMEPPEISNATTFWRCEHCKYESVREKDLYRATFHAEGCPGRNTL